MDPLNLFKATVNHEKHKAYLFYAGFCKSLERDIRRKLNLDQDENLSNYFDMTPGQNIELRSTKNKKKPDFSSYFEDIKKPNNAFINDLGVLEKPGSVAHFTSYTSPLRNANSLDDLEKFPYPNVDGYSDEYLASDIKAAHKKCDFTAFWVGHMYEDSWQIRGYEEFLMDLIIRPKWCEYILDRIKERNLKKAIAASKAGVDMLRTGDDVANQNTMMFSARLWRKIMKPRWAEVYGTAKKIKHDIKIWYHSDGNITEIIPDLIEIGVDILNPLQPECIDLNKIKKDYGHKIVFDGTIGTQTTMPFGNSDEVRRVIRERIAKLGQDGALILSPTHILEPEVPVKNVIAFVDEIKKRG